MDNGTNNTRPAALSAWQNMPRAEVDSALVDLYLSAIQSRSGMIKSLGQLMGPALLESVPIKDKFAALTSLFIDRTCDTHEDQIDYLDIRDHAYRHLCEVIDCLGLPIRAADDDGFELAHYLARQVSEDASGHDACVDAFRDDLLTDCDFNDSFWSRNNRDGRNGLACYLLSIGGEDCGRLLANFASDISANGRREYDTNWYTWVVDSKLGGTDTPDAHGYTLFECAAPVTDNDLFDDAVDSDLFCPSAHRLSHILRLWSTSDERQCMSGCPSAPHLADIGLDIAAPCPVGRLAGDILVDTVNRMPSTPSYTTPLTGAINNLAWLIDHHPHLVPSLTAGKDPHSVQMALVSRVQHVISEDAMLSINEALAKWASNRHFRAVDTPDTGPVTSGLAPAPEPGPML